MLTPVGGSDGRVHFLVLVESGGHSKVGKLDQPILRGEDVGALDVAMDNTLAVKVVEALKDLTL